MYIKYNEHEWVVFMSRKSVDHIFPTNILTLYDALVSTQQTITKEKTKTISSENAVLIFA
jgi:hypothetical protein